MKLEFSAILTYGEVSLYVILPPKDMLVLSGILVNTIRLIFEKSTVKQNREITASSSKIKAHILVPYGRFQRVRDIRT